MRQLSIVFACVVTACSAPGAGGAGADAQPGSPGDAGTPDGSVTQPDGVLGACTGKTTQARDATWTISVNGTNRQAKVHVPASYDPAKRTPVVINLHGRTSNGTQQAWLSRMIAKSDAAGFVVVHPESSTSPTSWNSGAGCCDPAYSAHVDDLGFMTSLLAELESRVCVDPDRVFADGLSNGGYLAHTLGCEMSDRIAAIGAVAGVLQLNTCHVTRPMPVFDVHGTADTLVSYSWVDSTIDFWSGANGCTTTATTYQQGDATCVTHGGCDAGAEVVLCTIDQGGHQWPGGETAPFLGYKSDDLIATDAMWEFFVAHPRPAAN